MPEKNLDAIPRGLREQYEKGVAALQKQNYEYALAILSAVLEKEPAFYAAREALRAVQHKKSSGRGGFFKKLVGTASSSPLMARAQLNKRSNPLETISAAEQILNGDPANAAAHRLLAEAALAADLPRTASLSFELAYKVSPDRETAMQLAEALGRAGQVQRAEAILIELSRTFPNDGEITQALRNLTAHRTLNEGGYQALADGSGSYRDALRDKAGTISLEQEQREHKTEDVVGQLIQENESRLAAEPRNTRLLRSIADLHLQKKDFDKAISYYEQVLATTEGSKDPAIEKAIADATTRRMDRALEELDRNSPEHAAQAAQIQSERETFALETARKRVARYPSDLQIRFELGELLFKSGRITEAIPEFQKAQNHPNRRIAALGYLGQCFSRRGMHDLAARTLQTAIKEKLGFDDEKKDLIYQLGCTYELLAQPQEAIDQFKLIYEVDIGYRDVAAKVDAFYAGH